MNIAIVTIYKAYNYGSFLQAFAMQETLKKMGHKVEVLNCSKKKAKDILKDGYIGKTPFRTYKKTKRTLIFSKDWKKLNIRKNKLQNYDVVIVGSDELWNIKNSFEHWKEYFGENLNCKKIIAYAPSIGYCPVEDFVSYEKAKEKIPTFYKIFARDENTKKACETIIGREIEQVCDPTILCLDEWDKYANVKRSIKEKYMVYYSYGHTEITKQYILRFAAENNLELIAVGLEHDWCDKNLLVEPLKFLEVLKNAEYVVTSTFHGSVFSTILKKRIAVRTSVPKVYDYINKINFNDKLFSDESSYEDFVNILKGEFDYESVRNIQKNWREESLSKLDKVL